VGAEVPEEQAYEAARLTALAILGSLKRELGDLDRVTAWLRVFGMVNSAPGFDRQPNVINGFSDLILEVYGPEAAVRRAEKDLDLAPAHLKPIYEFSLGQARAHRDVIARFGRHPHRNAVLGRASTLEDPRHLRNEIPVHTRRP